MKKEPLTYTVYIVTICFLTVLMAYFITNGFTGLFAKTNKKYVLFNLDNTCFRGTWCLNFSFRDPRIANCHYNNDTIRIVSIGDSVAFGWGVKPNETYSFFLEKMLNSNSTNNPRFEVLNFGVPGATMIDKFKVFKFNASRCKPKLVILQFFNDDVRNNTRVKEIILNLTGGKVVDISEDLLFRAYDIHEKELEQLPFEVRWKRYVENPLNEFVTLAKNSKIDILLLVTPQYPHNGKASRFHKLLKEYAKRKGILFLDISKTFDDYRNEKLLTIDGVHPSVLGHKIIAREIYKKIYKKLE